MIRYPGGKKKLFRDILLYGPTGYQEFRDVMCGGCGPLLSLPNNVDIWVNDIDPWVVKFWTWMRDDKTCVEQIMERQELTRRVSHDETTCRHLFHKWRQTLVLARTTPARFRAIDFLGVNLWAVAAIVSARRSDIASFSRLFRRDAWKYVSEDRARRTHERLQGARITCGDYRIPLHESGKQVWCYADPPYLLIDHNSPIYSNDWDEDDHTALSQELGKCQHDWFLTIGDCALSERLYEQYRGRRKLYCGAMVPHRHLSRADKNRTELWYWHYQ